MIRAPLLGQVLLAFSVDLTWGYLLIIVVFLILGVLDGGVAVVDTDVGDLVLLVVRGVHGLAAEGTFVRARGSLLVELMIVLLL